MTKKILIILAIITVCMLLASPIFAKQNVNIKITTEDQPFSNEGYIVIKVTDSNGRNIGNNGKIKYTITDSNGHYEWKSQSYKKQISVKKPNGQYKVEVKYTGNSKYNSKTVTKTVTVSSDGSLDPYTYYDHHNYGDNLRIDEYIYDNYWDEEIYDDASNYDGEGY